jgi:CheY-like chemotaxis protein
LWIDDFELGLAMYREMFEALGYRVLTASSGEKGVEIAAANRVDIVVTDYEMPGMNGETVAIAIKVLKPEIPVVLFSGSTVVSKRARAIVDAVCDKAGSREHLLASIHVLLEKKPSLLLQPPPLAHASDVRQRAVAYS